MSKRLIFVLVMVAVFLGATSGLVFAQAPDDVQNCAGDQILVKFLPGIPEETKAQAHKRNGGSVVDVIPGIDVQVVKVPVDKVKEKIKAYRGDIGIEFAEPDYLARAVLIPSDPYFDNQWGMYNIQAPDAWDFIQESSGVKIAICDTGIDQDHEDLLNVTSSKNFTRGNKVDDKFGHGTHVAGIAAASTNNNIGVAGAGFNSSLMNVKVLGDDGSGYYSWVAGGIVWAADNGARVISLSLAGGSPSDTLKNAVEYAWGKGCVLVAAAGNDNNDAPNYPAYYDKCIAVAATDQNDSKASFSNYGEWVDIAAPGLEILSTMPNHKNRIGILNYGSLSGTSMSTPHVAGVAALVFARHPDWSSTKARAKIEASTNPAEGFTTEIGRINAYEAVK